MKKFNKILALVLAFVMIAATLAGCGPDLPPENTQGNQTNPPQTTPGGTTPGGETNPPTVTETVSDKYNHDNSVTLRMAFGYNSTDAAISFNANIIDKYGTDDGTGKVLTINGVGYRAGDLKPTWVELEKRLGFNVEDKYQGNSAAKEFEFWTEQPTADKPEIIYGNLGTLNNAGLAGSLVNLTDYLDMMPNFKAYLDANPIVRLSLEADPETHAIYYSPYFDGSDDIERMPLMRTDWVEKLLNNDDELTGSDPVTTGIVQPYMPTSGSVTVDVVKADGSGVEQVTKNYDAYGNIVQKMNEAGNIDGNTAVKMLREYIDKTYGGYYTPDHRADLFIGQNAAWDADELVALLRCVCANTIALRGSYFERTITDANGNETKEKTSIMGIVCREDGNMQRKVDMYRLAAILFGVRGLESRLDYLYLDKDGNLHDARQEVATYEAMDRMHNMALEGLIGVSYLKNQDEKTEKNLENDITFMHYDYNQTQTLYNATKLNENGADKTDTGEKYMAVMIPVARWDDGTGEQFMRFTESWRSVKDSGIAIFKDAVADNEAELYAALNLIDYAFSKEGQILMSYGPDEFIKQDANGNLVTFNFNGEQWPEISDYTREILWDLAGGNYTNFARYFLGSTLNFLKSQSFEFQCTHDVGREGAGHLSTAIGLGVIKHPELAVTSDNYWYTVIPSALPIGETDNATLNSYTNLAGDSGKFGTSKTSVSEFVDIIINGYAGTVVEGVNNAAAAAAQVTNDYNGKGYLTIMQEAWDWALESYQSTQG